MKAKDFITSTITVFILNSKMEYIVTNPLTDFSDIIYAKLVSISAFSDCMLDRKLHISTFHACFFLLHVAQLFQQLSSFLPRQSDVCSGAGAAPTQDTFFFYKSP